MSRGRKLDGPRAPLALDRPGLRPRPRARPDPGPGRLGRPAGRPAADERPDEQGRGRLPTPRHGRGLARPRAGRPRAVARDAWASGRCRRRPRSTPGSSARSSATATRSRRSCSKPSPGSPSAATSTGRSGKPGKRARHPLPARARARRAGSTPTRSTRCIRWAKLGCVVFMYDMVGYNDSKPFGHAFLERPPPPLGAEPRHAPDLGQPPRPRLADDLARRRPRPDRLHGRIGGRDADVPAHGARRPGQGRRAGRDGLRLVPGGVRLRELRGPADRHRQRRDRRPDRPPAAEARRRHRRLDGQDDDPRLPDARRRSTPSSARPTASAPTSSTSPTTTTRRAATPSTRSWPTGSSASTTPRAPARATRRSRRPKTSGRSPTPTPAPAGLKTPAELEDDLIRDARRGSSTRWRPATSPAAWEASRALLKTSHRVRVGLVNPPPAEITRDRGPARHPRRRRRWSTPSSAASRSARTSRSSA